MTIRRRLFWSNILMILIPVALSALISYIILFMFTRSSQVPIEQAFPQAMEAVAVFGRDGDLGALYERVDEFNETFADENIFMVVTQGGGLDYPPDADRRVADSAPLLQALISDGAVGSVSINNMRFVIEQVDQYRILIVDRSGGRGKSFFASPMHRMDKIAVILLLGILIANRIVTHLLTKRIMLPLGKLAEGAHRLGAGELDYRIEYVRRDEFTPVCEDFNEMADQLQKLIQYQRKNEASRKQLLAGISHDLRTPLTSIRAYVEGLLDGVAEDLPAQLKYLGIIRNKAEDIDRIVDKLFLFSKLDIGEYPVRLEKVDLGEELRAMAATVEEEYEEKGLFMVMEPPPENLYISMDPVYLHNVFVNILENSLRYKVKERVNVMVWCEVDELSATVRVVDDGPGVEEDELEKIFDVFYRGDPSRRNPSRGSGLGLAISAQMMHRAGGSIHAEPADGGGLCVVLRFPRYRRGSGERKNEEGAI